MRRRWLILLPFVAAAILLVALVTYIPELSFLPAEPYPAEPRPVQTNLTAHLYRSEPGSRMPVFKYQSFTDRLLLMVDPYALSQYQGSYSLDDLSSGGEASSLSLSSSWLLHNPDIPHIGIIVRQNPDRDTMTVSGGELFFPGTGVGVSYERIEETDDTQAFLKFKQEF